MSHFDITNRLDREVRRCRTHALGARLVARDPGGSRDPLLWEEIAAHWDQLAALKMEMVRNAASASIQSPPDEPG